MKKKIIISIIIGVLILSTGCILYFNLEQDYSHLDIEDYHDNYICGKNSGWLPTRAQALRVTPGMSVEERIKIIGLPHDFEGSGALTDVYYLRDGGRMWIGLGGTILFSTTPFQDYEDFLTQMRKYTCNVGGEPFATYENMIEWIRTSDGKASEHDYKYNKHLVQPYEQAYAASLNRIRADGNIMLAQAPEGYTINGYTFGAFEDNGDTRVSMRLSDEENKYYDVTTFIAESAFSGSVTDYLKHRYDVKINSQKIEMLNEKELYFVEGELVFSNIKAYDYTVYFKVDENHYCAVATDASKDELMDVVNGLTFNKYDLQ